MLNILKQASLGVGEVKLRAYGKEVKTARKSENRIGTLPPDLVASILQLGVHGGNRELIWLHLSGGFEASRNANGEEYKEAVQRGLSTENSELTTAIDQDICRYATNKIEANPLYQKSKAADQHKAPDLTVVDSAMLRRILLATGTKLPEIGFNQSFCPMVRFLSKHIQDEESIFWCFAGILEHVLPSYYDEQMSGLAIDQHILSLLLGRFSPNLKVAFERLNVDIVRLTFPLFLCVSEYVSPMVATMVWDNILLRGSHVLFEVLLWSFQRMEDAIDKCATNADVQSLFHRSLQQLTPASVIDCSTTYGVAKNIVDEWRHVYLNEYKKSYRLPGGVSPMKKEERLQRREERQSIRGQNIRVLRSSLEQTNARVRQLKEELKSMIELQTMQEKTLREAVIHDKLVDTFVDDL
eukprot:Stramenopile-MAST_4_protein_2170